MRSTWLLLLLTVACGATPVARSEPPPLPPSDVQERWPTSTERPAWAKAECAWSTNGRWYAVGITTMTNARLAESSARTKAFGALARATRPTGFRSEDRSGQGELRIAHPNGDVERIEIETSRRTTAAVNAGVTEGGGIVARWWDGKETWAVMIEATLP